MYIFCHFVELVADRCKIIILSDENILHNVSRFTMFFVYLQLDLPRSAPNQAETEH
mgnify:CR=1 FL=1